MLRAVKLVSWNIQWGRGADGRVDLARIVEHARRFADFDVLCLQEVASGYPQLPGLDGSDQFAALIELFEKHGDDPKAMSKGELDAFVPLLASETATNLRRVFFMSEGLK